MIDRQAVEAAKAGNRAATYGWAFAGVAWKAFGAEGISQIADKGSSAVGEDKVSAGLELAAVLPFGKLASAAKGAEGAFSLLGAHRAVIDPRKITEYALNPAHPVGGNKAKVFESALGFTKGNADDLLMQLRQGVMNNPALAGKVDQFGARFTVDILVTGPAGSGVVRSGWIYKAGSDTPELTTVFVK